jgi:hypothetical protein
MKIYGINDNVLQIIYSRWRSRQLNNSPSERRNEHWVIITDFQQNPKDLKDYAKQHRLRALPHCLKVQETMKAIL